MENVFENLIYFIPDFILIFGIILLVFLNLHAGAKILPKWHMAILNAVIFAALLGFLPFFSDFLKLSGLVNIFAGHLSFTPFENYSVSFLNDSVHIKPLVVMFKFLITSSALVCAILSYPFVKRLNQKISSFTLLSLIAVFGCNMAAMTNDFLSLFISIEIVSVAIFFLIAIFDEKKNKTALEGSIKYLILNETAGVFFLLGMSYIYLNLGTINFSDINTMALNKILPSNPLLNISEILIFLSLAIKIGAYPFYLWVMDTFKASNYAVGLFIATTAQIAAVAILIKTAFVIGYFGSILSFALILSAVITLFVGSFLAFRIVKKEGYIKDFLAASTILNMGSIFLGISFLTKNSITAALYCLIVYMISNFALWSAFMLFVRNIRKEPVKSRYGRIIRMEENLASITGIAYISQSFAFLTTVCLLSLAGIPLTAGFASKFYLFSEILRSGIWAVYPLLFAAISAIIAVYCYFKLISYMFSKPENLRIYKKELLFNRLNVYTFILSITAVSLIVLFFIGVFVLETLNKIV